VVDVPHDQIWELAEHLSSQRSYVLYTCEKEYFRVTFLHVDLAAAQRLLDDCHSISDALEASVPPSFSPTTPAAASQTAAGFF
jgi:hypothetical protein